MKALLVKDLPCVDGLDRQKLKAIRGGIAEVVLPNPSPGPGLPHLPVMEALLPKLPPLPWGNGPIPGTIYAPYSKPPSNSNFDPALLQ
jgi:hypothetical protein